jgi:predicted ATPase
MSSSFSTFGEMLKFLRRRARLTQKDLSIAVGYSESHISRLEANERSLDHATLAALFVPALHLEKEPELAARLLELAAVVREEPPPEIILFALEKEIEGQAMASSSLPPTPLNNLTLQLTSFIGRAREIAELTHLFDQHRLITLTGSGGAGKSRLALRVAEELLPSQSDGAWLVEFASLSDPALVPQTIASVLGVHGSHDRPLNAVLEDYLRPRQLLLILDNCEHLIADIATLVETLLRGCPTLSILATSRETLNVPGEVAYRVPSLRLPSLGWVRSLERIAEAESVKLFVERARAGLPTFSLTEQNAPAVVQICTRLDGMPLAIELAAARIRLLQAEQIASRLDDRFHLLTGGSRTALPRHQTLRALVDWSYDLLSEAERVLLARLSVFSGGWTLDAAEAVVSDPTLVRVGNVLELLAQLVNKSLIVVDRKPGAEARYTMLQTIREFALEKLKEIDENEQGRIRHFDYFFTKAQQGEQHLFATESSIDWAETEIDNLRVALAWSLEIGERGFPFEERAGRGLELMLHVWPLWLSRGYLSEGNEWMKQLLAAHTAPTPARARALLLAGDFARYRGDHVAQAAFIQESLILTRKLGDKKRIGWALMEMGLVVRDLDRYGEAVSWLLEGLAMFQVLNDNLWVCRTSFLLAETHMADGNLEAARSLWEQGLALCHEADDKWQISWGLEGLGNLERLEGHVQEARQLFTESLKLKVSVMDRVGITSSLEAFAQLAATEKQFHRAVELWGASEQLRQRLNLLLPPLRKMLYMSLIPMAREQLGGKIFAAAWEAGKAMTMEQAIDFALAE